MHIPPLLRGIVNIQKSVKKEKPSCKIPLCSRKACKKKGALKIEARQTGGKEGASALSSLKPQHRNQIEKQIREGGRRKVLKGKESRDRKGVQIRSERKHQKGKKERDGTAGFVPSSCDHTGARREGKPRWTRSKKVTRRKKDEGVIFSGGRRNRAEEKSHAPKSERQRKGLAWGP